MRSLHSPLALCALLLLLATCAAVSVTDAAAVDQGSLDVSSNAAVDPAASLPLRLQAGAVDWAHQTAASLAALSPSDFRSLNSSQFASIPSAACAGLSVEAMNAIPDDACYGMQSACIDALQPATLAAISSTQVWQMDFDTIKGLSDSTLGSLSANFCSGFSAKLLDSAWASVSITQLSPQCLSGFTANTCAASLGTWLVSYKNQEDAARLASLSSGCVSSFSCSAYAFVEAVAWVHSTLRSHPGYPQLQKTCGNGDNDATGSDDGGGSNKMRAVWIVLGVGVAVAIAVVACCCYRRKRRAQMDSNGMDAHLVRNNYQV